VSSYTHPPTLVQVLAEGSVDTLDWLRTRVHLNLDRVSQLGGHSHARTHRPSSGMAGSELINALKRVVQECAPTPPSLGTTSRSSHRNIRGTSYLDGCVAELGRKLKHESVTRSQGTMYPEQPRRCYNVTRLATSHGAAAP
jgi:hypothetical protein